MNSNDSSGPWAYTRNQRRGLLSLLVLIAGCILAGSYLSDSTVELSPVDDRALFEAAARLRAEQDEPAGSAPAHESFSFDPNSVSEKDLVRLGLSEKQAAAFVKYRDKRPFRKASDIGNLFVLRPDQSQRLQSLARLPAQRSTTRLEASRTPLPPRLRFRFDPNTISPDSLQLLGFTEKEAAALVKYRSYRPTTFRSPEDLDKVNALNPLTVKEVRDLIDIDTPLTVLAPASPPESPPAPAPRSIDVNTAGPEAWQQLPGIGPYRAERIVDFRDKLGGFASVAQVGTTYGLPDSVFLAIEPYLTAGPIVRPLYVNRLSAQELAAHPYLKRSTAIVIVRYRQNHGPFTSVDDLKKVRALSTETLDALLPYLNFAP